ncbi:ATP-binding cassette domain-containing protein [bacterium]|nr:ATP-binding cassette domain-containing protein [bacterium]
MTRPIAKLSKGLRQRTALAQAILHRPKLLILDEPTVGLDPTQIVEIRGLIKRLAEHSTILFSSHILSEVEAVCDRVIIMINGLIKADARLTELAASRNAVLVLSSEVTEASAALANLPGVTQVTPHADRNGYPAYAVESDEDILPAIYQLARQQGWPVRELRSDTRTLEAVFNQLATSA